MRVSDILRHKGADVATVPPEMTVREVAAALRERGVGALVVTTDSTSILGIVSERDVVWRLADEGSAVLDQRVDAVMSTDVQTCDPGQHVDQLSSLMTHSRMRHLPVVVDGALSGIISIGDVVKARVSELEDEKQHLTDYITQGR